MHHALRTILATFAVTLFVFGATSRAPAVATVDLASVMTGSVAGVSVVVYATGTDDNQVYARFTNANDDTVQVDVPPGMFLEPADRGARTMVTGVGDTILWVEPGGAVLGDSVAYIQAFSAEMNGAAGAAGEPYSFAGLASGDLLLTLQNIDNRTAWDDAHAQAAVWHLTDGLDISQDQYAQELVVRGPGGASTGGDTTGGTAGGTAGGTTGGGGPGGGGRVGSGDRIPGGPAAVAGVAAAVLIAAAAAVTGLLGGGAAAAGSTGGGPAALAPRLIGALADAAGGAHGPAPQAAAPPRDADLDRVLYDPEYAEGTRPIPPLDVPIDPDSYDPFGDAGPIRSGPGVRLGPPIQERGPDVAMDIHSRTISVDFGGTGIRARRDSDGWSITTGERGAGPFERDVPDFQVGAGGFSAAKQGGQATVAVQHGGGRSTTGIFDTEDGGTTLIMGDADDRTILTQARDRYGVGHESGPAGGPTRTVAVEFDTDSGDFIVGRSDRRGGVAVMREGDSVGVGWSSARGGPGTDDDFRRSVTFDPSTGDVEARWDDTTVTRDDGVITLGRGGRRVAFDPETGGGTFTFGPSDGSRPTTVGAGGGGYMVGTRIPVGRKVDLDVMVNRGMRWTATQDMMPQVTPEAQDECWIGISSDWLNVRTGRRGGESQTWIEAIKRF